MSTIGQQLIENVRRIVAEKPDFVYYPPRNENGRFDSCQYVRNSCGDCLIGRALWDAGLITPDLEFSTSNLIPFASLADELGLDLDTREVRWLRDIQREQDNFRPWESCLEWTDNPRPVVS